MSYHKNKDVKDESIGAGREEEGVLWPAILEGRDDFSGDKRTSEEHSEDCNESNEPPRIGPPHETSQRSEKQEGEEAQSIPASRITEEERARFTKGTSPADNLGHAQVPGKENARKRKERRRPKNIRQHNEKVKMN